MENSRPGIPTIGEWISRYQELTNRVPSDGEIVEAIMQGRALPEAAATHPLAAPTYPAQHYAQNPQPKGPGASYVFSIIALGASLLGALSLWLPIASVFGEQITWFDEAAGGEGMLLLVAIALTALFLLVYMIFQGAAWKITAAIFLSVTGAFLIYDGFTTASNLGDLAGAGLFLMGIAGLCMLVSAVGLIAAKTR